MTNETAKGSIIQFRDGTKIAVTQRFTTAAGYLLKASSASPEGETIPLVKFDRADGTGRVWVGPAEAQHCVVLELV